MTRRALKCRLGVKGNTVVTEPEDLTQKDRRDKETQLCHIRAGHRRKQESRQWRILNDTRKVSP